MARFLFRITAGAAPLGTAFAAILAALASGPAVQAAGNAAPAKLTISYSEKVGDNVPLWIASDAGYFKKNGLAVTVRYLPAQEGVPALLSGQVQMAAIGGSDGMSAVAQGAKLEYVATFSPVSTFQFWTRPEYAHAKALKGQRVGITSTTGSLYIATVLALNELGLTPSDVAITPLGNVPNVDAAMLAGSIAAASSHPPATYQFEQHGYVDAVDLAAKRIPAINTGLLASDAYVRMNPKIVQAVVDAIIEGLNREKTDKAYAESEIAKYMGVKGQAVLDFTYNFYANEVAPAVPMPEAGQLAMSKQALGRTNAKVKALVISQMIDPSFVKNAVARGAR